MAGFEFDSQKVADLSTYAVTHRALKLAVRQAHLYNGLQGNGQINLQTRSRARYVFQVRHGTLCAAGLVLPVNIDKVGTEHPGFSSAIIHTLALSASDGRCHR